MHSLFFLTSSDDDDSQLAAVAALCVQYEADFRPNMSIVVKALQPLLNARGGAPGEGVH